MSSTLKFPSPVGGVPFGLDFGPSVLFASLYAIVAVGSLYRLLRSSSRTFATLGTTCNTIERVVIYTLRATQAHAPWEASSEGLTTYWQLSFSIGYLTILTDLCNVMQSLFVKTTLEQSEDLSISSLSGEDSKTTAEPLITDDQDSSTRRALYRKLFATEKLLILIPTALGCVAGSIYASGETNSTTANVTQILRYAAGACAFALILSVQISALWGYYTIPTLRKSSVLIAFSIATILNIKSLYRLVVMHNHTTSLASLSPGSLNTTAEKALFYVFHATPDFLAAAILLSINVRERFSTGLMGDVTKRQKKRSESTQA